MTVHLYWNESESWCRAQAGEVPMDYVISAVTCEACLEDAQTFGEKCGDRLHEIWNAEEAADRQADPVEPPTDGRLGDIVAVGAVGAVLAFGAAKMAFDGFRSLFGKGPRGPLAGCCAPRSRSGGRRSRARWNWRRRGS